MKKVMKLMISDWDGVFNSVKFHDKLGNVNLKCYKDTDMTAVKCFQSVGIPFVVLSGDPWNENICKARKIPFYDSRNEQGLLDKGSVILKICRIYKVEPESVGYVGDDVFDIPAFNRVGFAFCPNDASRSVLKYVDSEHKGPSICLDRNGGNGCLDEIFWKCLDAGFLGDESFDYDKLLEIDRRQMI